MGCIEVVCAKSVVMLELLDIFGAESQATVPDQISKYSPDQQVTTTCQLNFSLLAPLSMAQPQNNQL